MDEVFSLPWSAKHCEKGDDIELIDIASPQGEVVLLRTKAMPEFAFVMWAKKTTTTFSQLAFQFPNTGRSPRYSIVCCCCFGEKQPTEDFIKQLVETCKKHGIKTVFMRRASKWATSGLGIVEAESHADAYRCLYGSEVIREKLAFISYQGSQGLGRSY